MSNHLPHSQHYGVCLVPGSSCACPGYVRVSFANMQGERLVTAAARLKSALAHLVEKGMTCRVTSSYC